MHEHGMAKDLFSIILSKTTKKITKITIKIGDGSGVDRDFLKHSFTDHLFPGTIAENAELILLKEPISLECKHCGTKISTEDYESGNTNNPELHCLRCKNTVFDLSSGLNVYVDSIETVE